MDNKIELERRYSLKEFAIGLVSNRGHFGTKKDEERFHGRKDCYSSVFDHSNNYQRFAEERNSTAGYNGKVRFSFLAIDIDYADDLNVALERTRNLINTLETEYNVNLKHLCYYFSGSKGFHIEVPSWMIAEDHLPSAQYPQIFNAIAKELTEHADPSLYQTIRLYRINNTKNSKSGLFKIELSDEEILQLSINEIKDLAQNIRYAKRFTPETEKIQNHKLNELFTKYVSLYPDNQTENTFESSKSVNIEKIEIKAFDKIIEGCSYVKALVEGAKNGINIKNADRVVLGNLLVRFGEEGRTKLHEILSTTPNYDRAKTDYHLDQIVKQGYNPVSCQMICGNVCNTMKLLNRSSCLSLAYVSQSDRYVESFLVEKFIKYRTDVMYSIEEDNFYQYRDGVYHLISEIELASILTSFAVLFNEKKNVVASRIKAAIERLKMESKIQFKGRMNYNKMIINLKNGLFDLKSKQLIPHNPNTPTNIQLNFEYDPGAKAPKFEKFLNEILEEPDKVEYVLRTMCYLLIPDYSYQKVFIFFGSGRNGKSVLTSVISNLIGSENVASVSIHDLAQNRFSLIGLKDKLINISSEIGSRDLEMELIKKLSGGDFVTADRKYKEPLAFVNTARLIINANELPRFSELNEAILERFVLVKFPRTFRDDQVNTNLLSELLAELPGIFNLVVERMSVICGGRGGVYYPIPESILKDRIIMLSEISSAAEFINEMTTMDATAKIKLLEFFNLYEGFCWMRGYKALGYRNFKRAIESGHGITLTKTNDGWYVQGNKNERSEYWNYYGYFIQLK